jgi:GTP cyclohydrolase I
LTTSRRLWRRFSGKDLTYRTAESFHNSIHYSGGTLVGTEYISSEGVILLASAKDILVCLGEDPDRAGLRETPGRYARAMQDLTRGYDDDPDDWWRTFDAEGADQMICQWAIPLYSLCEHHILPFVGYAHIGYIPKEQICGLSKLKRVVDLFSRRLQVQERLTRQVADFLDQALSPRGVIVSVEAEHLCMTMRGVQTPGTTTTTSAVTGVFLDQAEGSRDEFYNLMSARRR